jgi:hypothetical protein
VGNEQTAESKQGWNQREAMKPQHPGFERIGFRPKLAFNFSEIVKRKP